MFDAEVPRWCALDVPFTSAADFGTLSRGPISDTRQAPAPAAGTDLQATDFEHQSSSIESEYLGRPVSRPLPEPLTLVLPPTGGDSARRPTFTGVPAVRRLGGEDDRCLIRSYRSASADAYPGQQRTGLLLQQLMGRPQGRSVVMGKLLMCFT